MKTIRSHGPGRCPLDLFLLVTLPACSTLADGNVPRPDHVVIVIEENHAYKQIIGSSSAPYINSLAQQDALFTRSFALTHPSQPNYLALFSGSTHGVGDECPHTFTQSNLGSELLAAGFTFTGYAESMPSVGFTGCNVGSYRRKHNPWVNFPNVPSNLNRPYSSFPSDFSQLPDLCFVVPNVDNDMHDGTIAQADTWLQSNFDSYVQWAKSHNSLFILTFDEDDDSQHNQIATMFVGAMVRPGQYSERIGHYNVLRTLLDMFGLAPMGNAVSAQPITDVWSGGTVLTINVTSPASEAVFTAPTNLTLLATASSSDNTVTRVEFFEGANKLGEATRAPFSVDWSNVPPGRHCVSARATDGLGRVNTSAQVCFRVNAGDTVRPTVAITSPTPDARLNSDSVTMEGRAGDNVAKLSVAHRPEHHDPRFHSAGQLRQLDTTTECIGPQAYHHHSRGGHRRLAHRV